MTGAPPGTSPDEEEQLADLRWHWDTAYEISLNGERWTARFVAGTVVLTAPSAEDLRRLIREDYLPRKSAVALEDGPPAAGAREMGAGERALRRLRDEGVI
jgi:sulfite reductase beta subunit-like hemoprotein